VRGQASSLQCGHDELVLVAEVIIDGAGADVCAIGDLAHTGAFNSALRYHRIDGAEQILTSLDPARPFSNLGFRSAFHVPGAHFPSPAASL
jgi:hypothetical protein